MSVHSAVACQNSPLTGSYNYIALPHASADSSMSFPLGAFLSCMVHVIARRSWLIWTSGGCLVLRESRLRSYLHGHIRIRPLWDIFVIFNTMKMAQVYWLSPHRIRVERDI